MWQIGDYKSDTTDSYENAYIEKPKIGDQIIGYS